MYAPIADPAADFAASVSDFTHLYADKPRALVKLCEFVFLVFRHLSRTPPGESDLYHTLLELYLSDQSEEYDEGADYEDGLDGDADATEDRYEKALNLLREGWATRESPKYDSEHVLVLCRMHGFKRGLVFLYERKGLLREVLQVYKKNSFFHLPDHNCRSILNKQLRPSL